MSHEIEAETNSERDELDTPDHEEAIDDQDQEEVKDATSGEEAKEVTKVAKENKTKQGKSRGKLIQPLSQWMRNTCGNFRLEDSSKKNYID